ncbi:MAG: T9SS type A sorting domain-containing protein [Saprospiraceae bacterium]
MLNKTILLLLFAITSASLFGQHVWERTNPGGGGAIASVGATVDGTILAASDLSGIYKSSNNGASWEVLGATQGLTETAVNCFGFHPTDGNTFIIGTTIGAYKTTHGGNTIYPVNIELSGNLGLGYVESVAMDMTTGNVGYMTHHEDWEPELSFLKTIDGGENWAIIPTVGLPFDAAITKLIVAHTNPDIVYALAGKARFRCSPANLYRSIDGGTNWAEIAPFADILDVDLHPSNSDIIYVSTFEANDCVVPLWQYVIGDEYSGAFFESIDGGISFDEISDRTGIISVGFDPDNISLTDIFYPVDWFADAGTWSTVDGGTNWTHSGFIQDWHPGWAKSNSFIYSYSFNGLAKTVIKDRFNPNKLYGAFGSWAWSSIDGGNNLNNISTTSLGNDQFISTGLENIEGNCIEVNDQNPNTVYIGAYDIGFWYSLNHGDSWKRSLPDNAIYPDYSWYAGGGSNVNIVVSDPDRENVVWASFSGEQPDTKSALFRSTESGENWAISNGGLDSFGLSMHGLSIDVNSPIDNRTLFVTQNGNVFKSVDDGRNWTTVLTVGGLKFTAVDQVNSQIVYAGGENGLWRSMDGGDTWASVGLTEMSYTPTAPGAIMNPDIIPTWSVPWSSPPIDAWQGIFDIKPDPNVEGRVYATAFGPDKGLYRSDDAGTTWTKLYANDKMRGIAIAPDNSDIIYASSSLSYHSGGFDETSIGFIVSYDGGSSWDFANEGLAWTNGGRMKIESGADPLLWSWSPGTGVQHTPIPNYTATSTTSSVASKDIEVSPNPVSDLLRIAGDFKDVEVSITNSNGQLLETINNASSPLQVNMKHLPSGLYMVTIKGESLNGVLVQKVVKE